MPLLIELCVALGNLQDVISAVLIRIDKISSLPHQKFGCAPEFGSALASPKVPEEARKLPTHIE
jgi:hypothetical protein